MENFEKIVNDIVSSFSMENLQITDETVLDMKNIYNNNLDKKKNYVLKRKKVIKYDFRRK